MAEGNGTPWWTRFVAVVGVPAAIAFFVLAMLAGLIPSPLLAMQGFMIEHQRVMVEHSQASEVARYGLQQSSEIQIRLLRQICRHVAKSESAQMECDR